MKKLFMNLLVYICFLMFSLSNVYSQVEAKDTINSEQKVVVKMNNGEEYEGTIVQRNEEYLTLSTDNGVLQLLKTNIKSIDIEKYAGKFSFANPNASRYFYGPSGIPLEKKHGYYQNIWVILNSFQYGVSKNISIGGGLEFFSTFAGQPIWFVTPKISFNVTKNFHLGGGVLFGGFSDQGTAGIGYGVASVGNSDSNISLGLGYAFAGGDIANSPLFMLSGTHRVKNSLALLSENYFPIIDSELQFIGIEGLRIMTKRSAFDVGLIVIPQLLETQVPFLPYVGYVFNF